MQNICVEMEETLVKGLSISKQISSKFETLEHTLHQTIHTFRELVKEFEQVHIQTAIVKKQMVAQNDKCESKCCSGSEELKKVIQSKDNIIQVVASALTKLNETKNLNIITEIFKILFEDSKSPDIIVKSDEMMSNDTAIKGTSPINLNKSSQEDMSGQDNHESTSEIEGTPMGRRSPIIQNKKFKATTPNTNLREKKRSSMNWLTPEKRSPKVTCSTPPGIKSGRLRQKRLNLVKLKPSNVVDLTSSPQFSMGRNSQDKCLSNNAKLEILENDDTILPSPTSNMESYSVYKTIAKEIPQEFQSPLPYIQVKEERNRTMENCMENITDNDFIRFSELKESSIMLQECHVGLMSPKKCKSEKISLIQANESMSLLQHVNNIQCNTVQVQVNSPIKVPLTEDVNFGNVPSGDGSSASMSRGLDPLNRNTKRTKSEILEPLCKEPTVRRKAEKRALPGWSCDECRDFYGELYKENPELLAKKMDECSKHRGRSNPVRPKTPPGFWNPRWDVPDGTEEFNRRNNAL